MKTRTTNLNRLSLRTRFVWSVLFCVSLTLGLSLLWSRLDSWPVGRFLILTGAILVVVYVIASVDRLLKRLDGFIEREQLFTATASHELRTPLAVIQGATEILIEHTQDSTVLQNGLTRIQRATAEMSEFIHALLMLSREDQTDTEPGELCDVSEVVPRVIEDQRELLAGRPIEIECRCDAPLRVQAPGSLATIVVGNLFRNAVAHTPSGKITCEILGRTLQIRDTGTGIAPEHLERVFDRSFTTRPGGYGVGLYLSKRICGRYGWQIQLESNPQGTTASVTF